MTPIDPVQPALPDPRSPMAPPYVDEDANEAMVEQGLRVAEDEVRDAVADSYEEGALEGTEPEEMMDDIDYSEAEEEEATPEIEAIHREPVPGTDE